jgi:hypothetical protein
MKQLYDSAAKMWDFTPSESMVCCMRNGRYVIPISIFRFTMRNFRFQTSR